MGANTRIPITPALCYPLLDVSSAQWGKGESPIDPWGVPSLTRRRYWLCTRLGLDIAEGKDFNYNSREGAGLDAPRSRDFLLAEDSRDRLARRRGP